MGRALAKPHVRVVGVDDGAFRRRDRRAPLAAVVVSAPAHVEAIAVGSVTVDGNDATERVVALVRRVARPTDLRAILLDGAVVGGFNIVDLDRLHRTLALPVLALTRRAPDFPSIRAALERWFPRTAARRYRLLRSHRLFRVPTGGRPLWASLVGASPRDARALLHRLTVQGYWPEPLRLAHLVASAHGTVAGPGRGSRAPTPRARA